MLQSPKAAAVANLVPQVLRGHRERLALGQQHHAHAAHLGGRVLQRRDGGAGCVLRGRGRLGGTFKDLFTSPVGFVTKDTAPIYGVTSTATTPTKMTLDATKRPGFLTRVGFLSTHAHDATSSPILRGAFITQRVLAIPVGQPDPSFLGDDAPGHLHDRARGHGGR